MAYELLTVVPLDQPGLTLSAQLVDKLGNLVGGPVTTGFIDHTAGFYHWTYAAFPDGFRGVARFSVGGIVRSVVPINPQEAEYLDRRVSLGALGPVALGGAVASLVTSGMLPPIILEGILNEQTTALCRLRLTDEAQQPLTKAQLTAFTLTLYDKATKTLIPGAEAIDLKADARAVWDQADSRVTITLKPADHPIITPASQVIDQGRNKVPGEWHVALLWWTWNALLGRGSRVIEYRVGNVGLYP